MRPLVGPGLAPMLPGKPGEPVVGHVSPATDGLAEALAIVADCLLRLHGCVERAIARRKVRR